jgi:hypothetical protein
MKIEEMLAKAAKCEEMADKVPERSARFSFVRRLSNGQIWLSRQLF